MEINKHIVELYISDTLETIKYYPGNRDGEYSENQWYQTVEDLYDAIQEDKPELPGSYIKKYMEKNHPYEIN